MKTFEEYQNAQRRTSMKFEDNKTATLASSVCLSGECGEILNAMKKIVWHGHDFDKAKLAEELGDVLWYASELAYHIGYTLDQVTDMNIAKLKSRYPDGFKESDSINRIA